MQTGAMNRRRFYETISRFRKLDTYNIKMDRKGGTYPADAGNRSLKAFPFTVWTCSKSVFSFCKSRNTLERRRYA